MKAPYTLRYMHLDDIPQVVEIDKLSFPLAWSARSYVFEINENNHAHMVTLVDQAPRRSSGGFMDVLRRLGGQQQLPASIVGYGGLWLIDGETHISTIAVHPTYRGQGLGELLLAGMLARSIVLKSEYAVLEVRVSNEAAINLYRKYEFENVGKRKGYYRDNNEDAYLMHLAPMGEAYQARFAQRMEQLQARVAFKDLFIHQPGRA
ncbi:MAG: ribosomal protein S18-alanine N-acetyltransferase [Chloroflexota bacterium]